MNNLNISVLEGCKDVEGNLHKLGESYIGELTYRHHNSKHDLSFNNWTIKYHQMPHLVTWAPFRTSHASRINSMKIYLT